MVQMKMKYTFDLPVELHADLKRWADAEGKTLREVLLNALKAGSILLEWSKQDGRTVIKRERTDDGIVKDVEMVFITG